MDKTQNNLIYQIKDKPPFFATIVFALQQLLAIIAATIAVPAIIGNGMSQAAALFGAGVGTLVYQLFTKFRSPVFLGSSFAFLPSMMAAFAGGVTAASGYVGLLIGAGLAGLVYVVLAIIVKLCGTGWIDKVMPAVVIGPIVSIIGLSLAGNAVGDALGGAANSGSGYIMDEHAIACLVCALVTLFTVIIASVFGKKMARLIPFIIGICAGYLVATLYTLIGNAGDIAAYKIIDFSLFSNMKWLPDFTFVTAFFKGGAFGWGDGATFWTYFGTIAVAYMPMAFVVFAEHLADHKNISSIIGKDLLKDPGLDRTLLGDGVGSMVGAFFGGCPNTTYGESIGCVAITRNASVITITTTAIIAIVASFFAPFITLLSTIPGCVMGGVCFTLYGFIAVSGLKMIQKVDLNDSGNLFTVATILVAGVGGMKLLFGKITITGVACALILGMLCNALAGLKRDRKENAEKEPAKAEPAKEDK